MLRGQARWGTSQLYVVSHNLLAASPLCRLCEPTYNYNIHRGESLYSDNCLCYYTPPQCINTLRNVFQDNNRHLVCAHHCNGTQ